MTYARSLGNFKLEFAFHVFTFPRINAINEIFDTVTNILYSMMLLTVGVWAVLLSRYVLCMIMNYVERG